MYKRGQAKPFLFHNKKDLSIVFKFKQHTLFHTLLEMWKKFWIIYRKSANSRNAISALHSEYICRSFILDYCLEIMLLKQNVLVIFTDDE